MTLQRRAPRPVQLAPTREAPRSGQHYVKTLLELADLLDLHLGPADPDDPVLRGDQAEFILAADEQGPSRVNTPTDLLHQISDWLTGEATPHPRLRAAADRLTRARRAHQAAVQQEAELAFFGGAQGQTAYA